MQILRRRGWELPEREATPEAVFRDRRRLIQAAAFGSIAAAAAPLAARAATTETDPTADLYPGTRNPAYTLNRPVDRLMSVRPKLADSFKFESNDNIGCGCDELCPLKICPISYGSITKES